MAEQQAETGSSRVVKAIVVINLIVFVLWHVLPLEAMAAHFLVSWSHLEAGRVWTLVSSVFSHNLLIHLFVNMLVLLSFGPPVERLVGSAEFLVFFLVSGVIASLAHAGLSASLLGSPEQAALGASGAIAAVLMFFSFAFPQAKVLLFFIVPLPAIAAAFLFIGVDLWGLFQQVGANGGWPIGHGAHLGGAVVGILYYLVRGRALRERLGGRVADLGELPT